MPLPPQPPLPPPPFSPPWPEDAAALTEPSQALAQDEWAGAAAYHVANNGGSGLLCGEGSGGGMSERWACLAAWLQHGAELVLQLLQVNMHDEMAVKLCMLALCIPCALEC
eukprot:scaffold116159_cov18-Tisochrysis_lutea.AAC.1